jgi:S-(hydroxymethyl)glutathione dehydrogenase/alcohol dehydrogenase
MGKRKVHAAVLFKQGGGDVLSYREVELDSPGPNELLVKVTTTGLCRSDLHYARGVWKHPLPVILGHEASGIVEEVGPGVPTSRIGEKVVLSFSPGCGTCIYCALGQTYNCDAVVEASIKGTMLDNTCRFHFRGQDVHHLALVASWSECTVVPAKGAVPVPQDVDLETAALLGCGVTAGIGSVLNTARVRPGDSVAIFGCGGVGLNAIQGARLVSAFPIIAIDINPQKKEAAVRFGASHFIDSSKEDPINAIKEITPEGVDFVFEVTGLPKIAELSYKAIRRGGAVILVGQPSEESLAGFPPFGLSQYDQKVIGSMVGSIRPYIDYPKLLKLEKAGKLNLKDLISKKMPLQNVNYALKELEEGSVNRILLIP